MKGNTATAAVGTSGYRYIHWQGVVYPPDLPKTEWFSFYTRHFATVEINNDGDGAAAANARDLRKLLGPGSASAHAGRE